MAEIWSDVLGIARIGAHDGFFALGGDSVYASQLIARVNQRLRSHISLREALASFTVEGLAQLVERERAPEHEEN